MDVLWMHLLSHLSQLCSDPRADVRISANQTLFRTITTNGQHLTLEAWRECIWNVLFPLLERVKISSERVELIGRLNAVATSNGDLNAPAAQAATRQESRPASGGPRGAAVSRQWDETKMNTLSGVTTSFITFFPILLQLGDDFNRAWALFNDYIRAWCLEGSCEVATAAVKSLHALARYPKDGPSADPAAAEKRDSFRSDPQLRDLWRSSWDTWEAIGLGIVASADESIAMSGMPAQLSRASSFATIKSNSAGNSLQLLHGSFSQETLTIHVSTFPDIYEIIRDVFGLFEFKRMLAVLSNLLLYHTNPTPGALPSRIRADNIADIDNMTPLQDSILNLVSGSTVRFDNIHGAPEAIMVAVAGFVRLPFVRLAGMSRSALDLARSQPQSGGMDKGFTYMALAKRSLQQLVVLIPPSTISPEEIAVDIDFDISVFQTFQSDVLEHMGQAHVSDELLTGLVRIIERCTQLYELHVEDAGQSLAGPVSRSLLSLAAGIDGDAAAGTVAELTTRDRIRLAAEADTERDTILPPAASARGESQSKRTTPASSARASVVQPVRPRSGSARSGTGQRAPSAPGVTAQSAGVGGAPAFREKFAKHCLECLLKLCAERSPETEISRRVAAVAAPFFLEKVRDVLARYCEDRLLYGRLPLPRIRNEEIILVLSRVKDLKMYHGILADKIAEDRMHPLRSHVLSGRTAHLFVVYGQLSDLLAVLARAGGGTGGPAVSAGFPDSDEAVVVDLARECLRRVGRELGVED
ncbi:hypothetical protein HK405_002979 [Cladochytrium tenue]|nr:hypothetical protein HK405_002979 [Cladochytrium tenue]